jgi:3-oxoacyl-[acyl-carrier-protein] synthase-1/3-oxoacyl-[acyl-carrier-protein] synthase II
MRARSLLLGYGSACDAYHLTAPRPDGAGLRSAIVEALATSGVSSASVAFVNAHGTGTPDNDRVEGRVLNDMLPGIPFLSTKGYTGHTLGAAGAIEAVFTAACLEIGKIPANAGFETHDPEIGIIPVREVTAVSGTVALSESLAFGGNNSVVVLGKA